MTNVFFRAPKGEKQAEKCEVLQPFPFWKSLVEQFYADREKKKSSEND